MNAKALIYCRVSSTRQKTQGCGLESQEFRCQQYAQQNGYQVEAVFHDDFSGGGDFWQRPAMRQLLSYLETNKGDSYTIIFDDLKRFARDIEFHWKLRKELKERNATPLCLNFNFEETPEGEFIETVIAGMGQLERKQNQRQVCQKMKARLEKGYWPFSAPLGLTYAKSKEHGKILVPKEPEASYVKRALEGFANKTFATRKEVQDFLNSKLERTVGHSFPINMINQKLYAGLIEYEPWGVSLRKGHHEALISPAVFDKNQERLFGKLRHFERKDNRAEFPLRGFVRCKDCERPLTASWSTGRFERKYPYYHCRTRGCIGGIKKQDLEDAFERLLQKAQPRPGIIRLMENTVQDLWNEQNNDMLQAVEVITGKIKQKEAQKAEVVQCAIEAANLTMRRAYESKAEEIEMQIQQLKSEIAKKGVREKVGTVRFRAREVLKNPLETWKNGNLKARQDVQNLVFNGVIFFNKKSGLGTAENALLYKVFSDHSVDNSSLVEILRNNWKLVLEQFFLESDF